MLLAAPRRRLHPRTPAKAPEICLTRRAAAAALPPAHDRHVTVREASEAWSSGEGAGLTACSSPGLFPIPAAHMPHRGLAAVAVAVINEK